MAGSEDVEAHGSGSVLAGALVAVAVNTLPAWGAWASLEDPRERTVLASDIDTWVIVVAAAAALTLLGILGALGRHRRFAGGLIVGLLLAVVIVAAGLAIDLVDSGGSLTG